MYGKSRDRAIDSKPIRETKRQETSRNKNYFSLGFLLLPAAAFLSSFSSAYPNPME